MGGQTRGLVCWPGLLEVEVRCAREKYSATKKTEVMKPKLRRICVGVEAKGASSMEMSRPSSSHHLYHPHHSLPPLHHHHLIPSSPISSSLSHDSTSKPLKVLHAARRPLDNVLHGALRAADGLLDGALGPANRLLDDALRAADGLHDDALGTADSHFGKLVGLGWVVWVGSVK
jgi:hypothetical protein